MTNRILRPTKLYSDTEKEMERAITNLRNSMNGIKEGPSIYLRKQFIIETVMADNCTIQQAELIRSHQEAAPEMVDALEYIMNLEKNIPKQIFALCRKALDKAKKIK